MECREEVFVRYTFALLTLLLLAPLAPAQQKGKKAASSQTMTACLDEKADYYVLRADDMLKEVAVLEPVGFEKQIFARYVGHKVSITGELNSANQPPTLRVTSPAHIKDISDMCVPASEK
jgi:hypothetical protein